MQGKAKYLMMLAAFFVIVACTLPEMLRPKFSEELEENAVVRMEIITPMTHTFLLMPNGTLYYVESETKSTSFRVIPRIVKNSVSEIKSVNLSKEKSEHIDDILYRIVLENSVYESTDTCIYVDYCDTVYTGMFKHGSGAVESLYLAFRREFGLGFPDSEDFKSYS